MKISNKPIKKTLFGLLAAGEVFEPSRKGTTFTYMRIEDSKKTNCNAVDLISGTLTYFETAEEVVPLYDTVLLRENEAGV